MKEIAVRLLKSLMRRYVYECTLKDKPWLGAILSMEEAIVSSVYQDWRRVLSPLDLSDPVIQIQVREVIRDALPQALQVAQEGFSEEEGIAEILSRFARTFQPSQILDHADR